MQTNCKMKFKFSPFKKAIILKRSHSNRMGLRECAKQIGISAATLSRLERGYMPDLLTYAHVCKWLNEDLNKFLK